MSAQDPVFDSYRFVGCEVRPVERMLIIRGSQAAIGSRAFDVLVALLERAGRVVARDALLEIAWPGLVVEENNLTVQVSNLRNLLGRHVIATIPGVGYRFSAPLEGKQEVPISSPPLSRSGNIPSPFPLIGREAAVVEAAALLENHRLITILGPGGVGKTRLGHAVARKIADKFKHGAWVVELAPLTVPDDPVLLRDLLSATVAQTLGLRLPGVRPALEEIAEELEDDERLLILDNCEHLANMAAQFASALVERTNGVRIIATSQTPLEVAAERRFRLLPLEVSKVGSETVANCAAVRLLVARVHALDPGFKLSDADALQAAEICRRLDGLPLAIELAAARVPLLRLAGVRDRLDDPLRVLTGGAKDGLPRHQTLRETIAWTHSLLTAPERKAFRRAGVFVGSFGLEQARRVLADDNEDEYTVIDSLGRLVDMSLVVVASADPPRYRLLESARAYALEKLEEAGLDGEEASTKRRHVETIDDLFQQSLDCEWQTPSQMRRLRFLPDLDNGRAALEWSWRAASDCAPGTEPSRARALERHVSLAAGLAWLFADTGQGAEGLSHCQRALSVCHADTPPKSEAWLQREICRLNHGGHAEDNLAAAHRAVALLRPLAEPQLLYKALGRLSITLTKCGHLDQSEVVIHEMQGLRRGDWPGLSEWDLLNARDYLANDRGDYKLGEEIASQELALANAYGDSAKKVFALMAAEQCAASLERYAEAVSRGRELIQFATEQNEPEHMHVYMFNLAISLAMCGEIDEALTLARRCESLDGRRASLWKGLELMALLAWRRGRVDLAARILGRSDMEYAGGDGQREPVERNVYQLVATELERSLGISAVTTLKVEGAMSTVELLTTLALAP